MSTPGRPPRQPSSSGGGSGGGSGGDGNGRHVIMSGGRGAVMVGIAVVVAIILYAVVDGSRPGTTTTSATTPTTLTTLTPGDTTQTTAANTTETTKAKKTSSTTSPTKGARPNGEVVVQVLNGSGVSGAASTRTNDLVAKGYKTVPAGNSSTRTGTVVQCAAGYDKESLVLAQTLGDLGVPASVEPLPNPKPTDYDAAANCYVILGK